MNRKNAYVEKGRQDIIRELELQLASQSRFFKGGTLICTKEFAAGAVDATERIRQYLHSLKSKKENGNEIG